MMANLLSFEEVRRANEALQFSELKPPAASRGL